MIPKKIDPLAEVFKKSADQFLRIPEKGWLIC
jgi:hypothetical protein